MRRLLVPASRPEKSPPASMQLAIDEAMLVEADQRFDQEINHHGNPAGDTGWFRWWQFDQPTVVLGRSSQIQKEVQRDYCTTHQIPVLRRCTGGAAVVGGPGCGMYSVVVPITDDAMRKVDAAHDYVMSRVLSAVRRQEPRAKRQGICDLTLDERKFSGNSLRVSRFHLLYHGTILHAADLDLIDHCLDFAPRQPDYRRQRSHGDFVGNLEIDSEQLSDDLAEAFGVTESVPLPDLVREHADRLHRDRYSRLEWTELR